MATTRQQHPRTPDDPRPLDDHARTHHAPVPHTTDPVGDLPSAELRIDLPSQAIGLPPAPHTVDLVPIEQTGVWTLLGITEPGRPADVAQWLDALGGADIEVGAGLSPRTLRADFTHLPSGLDALLHSLKVRAIEITPEGTASVFVGGDEDAVLRYIDQTPGLQDMQGAVRVRPALGQGSVRLTKRQRDVLSTAVALGYYEVPHKVGLRELAAEMGVSLGAVSELLRRAESQIVRQHVDALTESRVEALLRDSRPPRRHHR